MSRAIFVSTGQAIHFSYLIQAFEASPESQLAKELRKHQIAEGGGRNSTVDFGQLNPLEIRAQAAMIRGAVESKLPKHEANALKARYGIVQSVKQPDGTLSIEISEERRQAIIQLAEYLHPQFDSIPRMALSWLVCRAVGNVASMRPPFKTIATMHGGEASTLSRAMPKLLARLASLEMSAVDKLTPIFEEGGLVQVDVYSGSAANCALA